VGAEDEEKEEELADKTRGEWRKWAALVLVIRLIGLDGRPREREGDAQSEAVTCFAGALLCPNGARQ